MDSFTIFSALFTSSSATSGAPATAEAVSTILQIPTDFETGGGSGNGNTVSLDLLASMNPVHHTVPWHSPTFTSEYPRPTSTPPGKCTITSSIMITFHEHFIHQPSRLHNCNIIIVVLYAPTQSPDSKETARTLRLSPAFPW
ncbi:fungal mating-type pheromone [Coprinopsis cinerea AmutBmut pab1-1]|nr:fungal mating-type pheromone [Coprinopsis cinerea AmutBmut pab1-1]